MAENGDTGSTSSWLDQVEKVSHAGKNDYHWAHLSASEKHELENLSRCFIYRVPEKLRVHSEKFSPRIVSIGPYHRDNKKLEVSGIHKKLYLESFISSVRNTQETGSVRNTQKTVSPSDILSKMDTSVRQIQVAARECYSGKIEMTDDEFVQLLILDGCFLLELFHKFDLNEQNSLGDDAIFFNNNWSIPSLRRDLVLLENQIPFDVLLCLNAIHLGKQAEDLTTREKLDFSKLILNFFDPILPTISQENIRSPVQGKHLLDLLRNTVLPQSVNEAVEMGDEQIWEHTICAVDLQDAGVQFKKRDTSQGLLDIKFADGKFEIPPFYFGESWIALFPNMIALEQCRGSYPDMITSYAILMDNLVNSSNDVKLLREKGIIRGSALENETIATAINNLCKGAHVDKFYYDLICNKVNAYSKTGWNRWRAVFVRNYIHTPWAGASALAAVFLLLLTTAQTVFTVHKWN